ncbi:uncharacterized protein [Dermacentor albipictus]|uniref:uncharacterized protein isoform X1 n=1 Tax=Dermacentor albipictus TaxID=60249 RepID=UPI0038FCA2B9
MSAGRSSSHRRRLVAVPPLLVLLALLAAVPACVGKKLHKMAVLAGAYGIGAGGHLLGGLGLLHGLHGLYSHHHGHHHGYHHGHHYEHHVSYAVPVPVPVPVQLVSPFTICTRDITMTSATTASDTTAAMVDTAVGGEAMNYDLSGEHQLA